MKSGLRNYAKYATLQHQFRKYTSALSTKFLWFVGRVERPRNLKRLERIS